MGLFSELKGLGLDEISEEDIFKEDRKTVTLDDETESEKSTIKKVEEIDLLFDKTYTCPICDREFKAKAVRAGKLKLISQDMDLRPVYDNADPLKYDAIVCPKCGYAALVKFFGPVSVGQLRTIRQEICANFKGIPEKNGKLEYEDAIMRHKLALVCAVKRNAKNSEKAYICLKLAWLYRGEQQEMLKRDPKREQVVTLERECLEKAYVGFVGAFSKENFPMCGMDEVTLTYMMAELAHGLQRYEEAARLISKVLVSKQASQRIKDKALDLKEILKNEIMNKKSI